MSNIEYYVNLCLQLHRLEDAKREALEYQNFQRVDDIQKQIDDIENTINRLPL